MVGLFDGKLNEVKSRGLFNFRNALLTIQFFFLIGLLSITLMIRQQMDYVQNRDLGFNQEGVLYFGMNGKEKYQRLKQELKQLPGVKEVGTGMIPGMEMYNQLTYQVKNSDVTLSDGTLIYTSLDALKVLGIDSEAFVSLENGQDSVLIVNQTAAKKLANVIGVSAYEMIGETLVTEPEWENEDFGYGQHYMIADVIDDFDYFSLRYPSQSLIMEVRRESEYVYNALVSIEPEGWFETVSAIEAAYLKVEKELPFDAMFLDDHLQQLYSKERSAGLLATSLTGICIVLAVMGLLGIVGFVTQSRQKEMGIRKVFGATTLDILLTINRSYVVLIVISTAIAVPTALYLGQKWLENFAYRITPSVATVILAGGITLALVVVLVVIQSFKTARINPSDTLRYE